MKSEIKMEIEEFIWNHIPREKRIFNATETNPKHHPWINAYIEFCNNTLEE